MDKMIGVLGGMGSLASETFYKMVIEMTEVDCDQDYPNMVIFNDAAMPDRTKAILANDYDEVADKILNDLEKLKVCGCEAVGITCNTAHFFVDLLETKLPVKVIHMVNETVNKIAEEFPGSKVAILATDGTIKTGLYQKHMEASGLEPFVPDENLQKKVMYEIYDCVKAAKPVDKKVWSEIDKAIKDAGCTSAILGCTELSVIKEQNSLSDEYIDPMRVLAEKLIVYSGKRLR